MESKMEKATKILSLPKSVFLEPMMNHRLANEYWTAKCSHSEYSLLMPSEGEQWRPISSFSPQILLEFHLLLADWRSEARKRVACMDEKERQCILASVGIQAFSEDVLFRKDSDRSDGSHVKKLSQRNHITSVSWRNSCFVSGMRKRKPTQLVRGSRPSKFSRPSNYSQNSSWSRKLCYNKPILKRRNPKKTFASHERLKKTMYSEGESQYLDEVNDEEEDQLTAIVSRQRQAFSARVAAGRPSIRKIQPHLETKTGGILCTTNSVPAARRLSSKVLRAWKSMAKKIICKMARQRVANRRDKMIIAKRAARECARLLRQKALLSQKAARDSISRGHRLSREITSNWRNSTSNVANGSAPLTINGVTMPSCSNTTHFSSCMDLSDYYTPIGLESRGLESNTSASLMESSTAARRRAEKAAAEQRKADLELLEARRQQRKLNFLITQTELYAHFMAKKMADVNSDNYKSEYINGICRSENPEVAFSNANEEDSNQEAEAQRILRRLEEMDDDSVEIKANEEGTDTGSDLSTPLDSVQNDQDYVGISSGSTYRKSYSSIAVAAKAAACRLGINAEEEYDIEQAKSEALMKVKTAVTVERNRVSQFHTGTSAYHNLSTSASNNTDVTTAPTQIEAPKLFKGQLKAYQVRGLNWLLGLFDQGINGILADEMGLGKTIQTVAFLGCLAENYNIWGPFLIVTPASTLHNWTQEFSKFLPAFRLVPYWGTPAERKVLRRFWSSTRSSKAESSDESGDIITGHTGTKHSELHVVITSYQVVLQDAKFINKTSWSYIVLDEAHAIKSTSSLRWKILLSFKCRNRLLLTGTPIQNTMQELWALLHFIMPTLFDSHDEFANWFSRDIESQASATARTSSSSVSGGGGSGTGSLITSKLNENQLSRLHLILKPFMLRRTKAEVEHEISTKTEIMLYCPLSHRQQILYERLRNKIRLEDLSSIMCTNGISDNFSSILDHPNSSAAAATAHLINLVMQLRKVCNHPDLWERRDVHFSCITGQIEPTSCLNSNNSDIKYHAYNNSSSQHALWRLPNLLYENGALSPLSWRAKSLSSLYPEWPLSSFNCYSICLFNIILKYFNLYHPFHVHEDLWHHDNEEPDLGPTCMLNQRKTCTHFPSKCFSFTRLLGLSINDYVKMVRNGRHSLSSSQSNSNNQWTSKSEIIAIKDHFDEEIIKNRNVFGILKLNPFFPMDYVHTSSCSVSQLLHLHGLLLCQVVYESSTILSNVPSVFIHYPGTRPFIPHFVSAATTHKVLINPLKPFINTFNHNISYIYPLLSYNVTIPLPRSLELVSRDTRISDSGKLTALDSLLTELKANGHRILIYSQMTRMIDILEEFMLYRKHAYLRLDGSSRLSDRRDMVAQWQTNPRWFVFLLSTRAGGLGINLTAADTVIFYDSDWNPTVDQQAMDRAHRLGQTKPVTVYRLICKNTVEGRMLRRAEEKRAMQQMVIQSGQAGLSNLLPNVANRSGPTEHMTSSDMVSLLLDDDELVKRLQIRRRLQPQRGRPTKNQSANRLIVPSPTVKVSSNITNLSNTDNEMSGTKQQSSEDINSTELSSYPQRASLINSVDEDLSGRKRQAACAEQSPSECIKKIRPMKTNELATISAFDGPVITCNSDNNNSSNNVT
ncbi:hypothetical protein MN116_004219 [Schistosoma mekongi]|uniref:Chromatin-remodeling ATPase INO80 n=1 Tax=Schistosoma mekongi TaxID=38744 RepID=A0AAE1ZFR6_SCHME|nr:hypothetical protein MN116_004219 [Schistosoma mekongi]